MSKTDKSDTYPWLPATPERMVAWGEIQLASIAPYHIIRRMLVKRSIKLWRKEIKKS